tara:strand:+ start:888 stop:1436 length:549 start_codon:yes stop_codon:yes gene_type:complete
MRTQRIILGLDPGTNLMGFGIIKKTEKSLIALQYGVINMNKEKNHMKKLRIIFEKVTELINQYKPHEISIESPFYGKNVQSMLKLGRAQGAAITAGEISKIKVSEYAPKKIKQSVTGNGNASKEQLSDMVKRILNLKLNKNDKLDATDALGAAICHLYQKSSNQTTKKSWKQYLISNPEKLL